MTYKKQHFHEVVRSERYFTATLLPHLLISNDFEGLKLLFRHVLKDNSLTQPDDFEIITELDPLRDGSVYNQNIKTIYRINGRIAVPDLFLRWGTKILIIEAKFFTQPSVDELQDQLKLQWDALLSISAHIPYPLQDITQCLLMINKPSGLTNPAIHILTWSDISNLFKSQISGSHSNDFKYALDILTRSIDRARNELTKKTDVTFTQVKTIEELILRFPEFIKSGKIWVGFSEGLELDTIDLDYLKVRSHYRVSDKQYTINWIRIDKLVSKYIDLCTK